ncbi:ANK [Mytilus coruscus]|uniref:ANK n=1 Tax=Mytilus coruscus TaxID=42192 RepID=A0A6J7ZXT3_MYTCO|nr:ANK [Mytilus coruscus]
MLLDNLLHPVSLQNVSIFSNTLIEKNHFFDDNTKYHTKLNLTPFQVALILGFSDIVEIFVDYGLTDVNSKFYVTPLLLSSLTGNDSSIIEVLENYNVQDEHCKTEVTPLLYATLMNHCELINILLNNNASVTYAADISLLDIISIHPEITSLILTCRATFSLTSRCRVNSLFVALLQDDEDVLQTSLPFLGSFNDSTDITIIHLLCFRGYIDHLKIVLNSNINANNTFSIQCSHLVCVSQLTDDIDDYLEEWKLPWNRYQFALNISLFEFCCLFSEPYVLQSLLGHPIIMQTFVNVTPCLLTLCLGEQKPPCLFLNRQRLKSTFPICLLAWFLYCKTCDAEKCHHLPDFVVADLSNLCTIEDSDIIVYSIDFDIIDTDDISENLEHLGLCTSVNFSILLAACLNQKWDAVLQMMNFSSLSSNYIRFGIVDLICLRNIDIRDFSCPIPSQGFMISALELEFLTCGNISDILFYITEAKENQVFFTSAIAVCLHNNKRNLKKLLYWNVDMNITYTIPCLHLMCFMDVSLTEIVEIIPYQKMKKISKNAELKNVHVACFKDLKKRVLMSLMMKCNVNSFATLSSLHIILLTGNTQYLEEYVINENFSNMAQMAPIHILCFRQNNDAIKGLSHTQCDFNSIATNLTFLHLKFLTNEDICVHKSEKHNNTLSELTPLHIASLIDDAEITELILRKTDKTDIVCKIFPLHMEFKYNKEIALLINSYTSFNLTAFHIACIQKNKEIGELLIRRNANLNLPAEFSIEFEISELVTVSTHSELFPLHLACLMQNVTFTRMILSQVQTINDTCPMSVWHICLFLNESIYAEKLSSFSEYRDSVCMLSPLHLACLCGNVSILTLLLRKGADSKAFANLDSSYAIIYEKNDTNVKLFFLYHYKVLKYPLHICAENGNIEQCRVLLESGADTNVETSFASLRPWHLALYHGQKEILSLLLETPTEIDKKKFLIIFFMYLFRKKYNKQSANTRIKLNMLVILSLYKHFLPVMKDIAFM